MANLNFWPEFR